MPPLRDVAPALLFVREPAAPARPRPLAEVGVDFAEEVEELSLKDARPRIPCRNLRWRPAAARLRNNVSLSGDATRYTALSWISWATRQSRSIGYRLLHLQHVNRCS